ncbi:MAG TPA: hypothetical protein VK968_01730 [Roseimicrobium sp.]|nr:hypothetical protein [Roseimicrobium sp.]
MQFNRQDHRRRSLGLFLLVLPIVATIWGRTVLRPYLDGAAFLLFWSVCLLMAIVIALIDMAVIGLRCRAARKELVRKLEQSAASCALENWVDRERPPGMGAEAGVTSEDPDSPRDCV